MCRSRKKVRVRLPHGRGVKLLAITVTGEGHAATHISKRRLKGSSLSLSLFGYRKRTVDVAIEVRSHGRVRTLHRKLHPCG